MLCALRWALVAALLAVAGRPAPAVAQADSAWWQHDSAARRAYRAGDFATYRAQLLAQRRLIGAAPRIDYGLAVAESRLGNHDRALEWLQVFADMGLWRDVSTDADLAPLRALPGYPAVAARLAANRTPIERSAVAFALPDADLVAEDIAYDAAAHRFLVSSVHRGTVIAVDSAGHASEFIGRRATGSGTTWGILALGVDQAHGILWATTVAVPAAPGYTAGDSGRSALLGYDLATGALRQRIEPPPPARGHALGDMTLAPDGTVYVADGAQGTVFALAPGASALSALVPRGTFRSPQTPALAADGRRLFVADYARGIAAIDLASGAVTWLAHPGNVAVDGIDGLYRVDATLLAVQNGTMPNRLLRLLLDGPMARILGADVLDRGTPVLDEPTHGVIVGDAFYFIARSGWSRVRPDGTLAPAGPDDGPVVRRILVR